LNGMSLLYKLGYNETILCLGTKEAGTPPSFRTPIGEE
jgi:hypothetical protein